MNKVMLGGFVGNDPVVKFYNATDSVTTFNLYTRETYTNKDGQNESKDTIHHIVARKKLGQTLAEVLEKGSYVLIEGRISRREYKDTQGQTVTVTEIEAFTYDSASVSIRKKKPEVAGAIPQTGMAPAPQYQQPVPPLPQAQAYVPAPEMQAVPQAPQPAAYYQPSMPPVQPVQPPAQPVFTPQPQMTLQQPPPGYAWVMFNGTPVLQQLA